MSRTVKLHLAALLLRCGIFFTLLYACFTIPDLVETQLYEVKWRPNLINILWLIFSLTMIRRLFPNPASPCTGHQKQFAYRFQPTEAYLAAGLDAETLARQKRLCNRGIVTIAIIWCLGNGVVFFFYSKDYFDERVLLLLSAAFSICDIICILFWCPFQRIWMRNHCCMTCRIYNWDFIMMCTPLLVIPGFYARSLCALAIILLVRWELTAFRHPERFFPAVNTALHCQNCTAQLCQFKRKK